MGRDNDFRDRRRKRGGDGPPDPWGGEYVPPQPSFDRPRSPGFGGGRPSFNAAPSGPETGYSPSPASGADALSRRCRMATLLWILAVVLVVAGIVAIVRKQLLWGIVLIVVGLLVGPGGVSVFT